MRIVFLIVWVTVFSVIVSGCDQQRTKTRLATDHWLKGELGYRNGQYGLALQEFKITLQLDPSNWPAHSKIGMILERNGDLAGAIIEYEKVIQIDYPITYPAEKAYWHSRLAGALLKFNKKVEARREYALVYKIASSDQRHSKKLKTLAAQALRMAHQL